MYVSAEELMDLEHARLVLRGEHGLAVDRGRIVREAVAVVLAVGVVVGLGSLPDPGGAWAAVPDLGARPLSTRPCLLGASATIRWSRPPLHHGLSVIVCAFRGTLRGRNAARSSTASEST